MKAKHHIMSGSVWHRRLTPVHHGFSYVLNMVLVDLDDIDGFQASHPLLGARRRPLTLRSRDFVDQRQLPLAHKVREKAAEQGLDFATGRVLMLAQLRGLGWQFNPLVLYWHFANGATRPDAVLAEVRNTPWKERHWYALGEAGGEALTFFRHPKAFHVSPFMDMNMEYQWQLNWENPLCIRLSALRDGEVIFEAGMRLQSVPVSRTAIWKHLPGLLLQGLRTSLGIHVQALHLWRKKVPIHRHPDKSVREGDH